MEKPTSFPTKQFSSLDQHAPKLANSILPSASQLPSWQLKILFDGACPFCKKEIQFMEKKNAKGLLCFEDISSKDFDPHQYGLTQQEAMGVIHAISSEGKIIKKVDVFIIAYELLGLGWLVKPLSWPIIRPLADIGYALFARYRVPLGKFFTSSACEGTCSIGKK